MEIFDMVAEERRGVADLLETLDESQLDTPSLCAKWKVRDVAAHLAMPLEFGLPKVMIAMARSAGNFDKANDRLSRELAERPVPEIAGILRTQAENRFTPPTAGPEAPLTDLLVHGQDMRRPLGLTRDFPEQRLRIALDFVTGRKSRGFVGSGWLDGLELHATDLDWTSGSGAALQGSGEALLLAMTGRAAALADLQGDGVAIIRPLIER